MWLQIQKAPPVPDAGHVPGRTVPGRAVLLLCNRASDGPGMPKGPSSCELGPVEPAWAAQPDLRTRLS